METLLQSELSFTIFMQALGEGLRPVMMFFSFLGTEEFFLFAMPLLLWCIDARMGTRIAMMLILTNGVKNPLKIAFHGPRPYWIDPDVKAMISESSFGIPSGHAQDAASLWGLIAAILRRWWVTLIAGIVIAMIGLSRIYLGVHFTHDVLVGWVIGLILVLLFVLLDKPVSTWFNKSQIGMQILAALLVSVLIIAVGFAIRWALGSYTVPQEWVTNAAAQWPDEPINPLDMEPVITMGGLSFGFILGLALLSFTHSAIRTDGPVLQRIGRFLLGIVGLLALYFGLRLIFPTEPLMLAYIFRYLRYALLGVWVAFFAPWLFLRLKLAKPA